MLGAAVRDQLDASADPLTVAAEALSRMSKAQLLDLIDHIADELWVLDAMNAYAARRQAESTST